jgi:hypothetical protein
MAVVLSKMVFAQIGAMCSADAMPFPQLSAFTGARSVD